MFDKNIPSDFLAIQDPDETLLWLESPNFSDFILYGVGFLLFGILWGVVDFGIVRDMQQSGQSIPLWFLLVYTAPLWLSVLNLLRLILVHANTFYAFSNKRVLARTGFFGTDFFTIDYDQITNLKVYVNPFEKLTGMGTVLIGSGSMRVKFIGIKQPYEVFKQLKQTMVDIKTDWYYPNAKRPKHNPGYRTKYNRKR